MNESRKRQPQIDKSAIVFQLYYKVKGYIDSDPLRSLPPIIYGATMMMRTCVVAAAAAAAAVAGPNDDPQSRNNPVHIQRQSSS
jgi:hypothetical protein